MGCICLLHVVLDILPPMDVDTSLDILPSMDIIFILFYSMDNSSFSQTEKPSYTKTE